MSWMREEEGGRTGREGGKEAEDLRRDAGLEWWRGIRSHPLCTRGLTGTLPGSTPSSSWSLSPELLAWENRLVPAPRWVASGPGPT